MNRSLEMQRQAERQRCTTLQKALATRLAQGHATRVNGRIGIRSHRLFALSSARRQPEGRELIRYLAAPLAQSLQSRGELLMLSGFTDDQPVRGDNHRLADNRELPARRAPIVPAR